MRLALHRLVATALLAIGAAPAGAQVLRFDEVLATTNGATDTRLPLSFYNGGGGPAFDFGIEFRTFYSIPPWVVCLGTGQGCLGSRGVDPVAAAQGTDRAAMYLLDEPGIVIITHTAGFTTGFSFVYSRAWSAVSIGSARVYSGPGATGTVLASVSLSPTPYGPSVPGCGSYTNCPFVPVSLPFAGTAHSVVLTAAPPPGIILYDDLTFGSTTPGVLPAASPTAVPEPTTIALTTTGLLAVGAVVRRRRKTG